jgi:hypothetical protein
MPVVQQIVPTRGREFWDSLDPNNIKQVLEAVKEEVRAEKNPGSPCKVLIPILNSLTDQSQHTSFTIVRVDRAISLSRPAVSGSASHVSAIARYSCSAARSSSKDKDE